MRVTCILSGALLLGRLEMTPGVVANVREVISSSLRSWIIESLDHFGVDSRVFLHVTLGFSWFLVIVPSWLFIFIE